MEWFQENRKTIWIALICYFIVRLVYQYVL